MSDGNVKQTAAPLTLTHRRARPVRGQQFVILVAAVLDGKDQIVCSSLLSFCAFEQKFDPRHIFKNSPKLGQT